MSEWIGWAMSRNSPSGVRLLGIATKSPLLPSMTLRSWITNASSNVMDTSAFILLSWLFTFRSLTSVIFIVCFPQYDYCWIVCVLLHSTNTFMVPFSMQQLQSQPVHLSVDGSLLHMILQVVYPENKRHKHR